MKDSGPVARVKQDTEIGSLKGTAGIAHSRYNSSARDDPRFNAREMCHPFLNDDETIALMHNGTIYNYRDHWGRLREIHPFRSYVEEIDAITDSEVAVHMLSDALAEGKSMEDAFREITPQLTGGFLLSAITPDEPETVWIANWYQPCVIAVGDNEAMYCSSPIGFHDIRHEMDRIFEPPGKVEVTTMDQGRRLYDWRMDEGRTADVILRTVKERKEIDVESLFEVLNPAGWAEAFGVSPESFRKEYLQGFRFVNEYFGFMDKLVASGFLREKIDLRTEGGYPGIGRASYSPV